MKKFIVITLVVLLTTLAIARPALADSSAACDGLSNALHQVSDVKGHPAVPVLNHQMKVHCGGGEQQ